MKKLFLILAAALVITGCATNKNVVMVPEWARVVAEENERGDFSALKWIDGSGLEVDKAEYMTGEGVKLRFEANAESARDGEEVFALIYRSNAESKDDFMQKIPCAVKNGKVSGEILIKETDDVLASLSQVPAYFFALGSQISAPITIAFAFKITIWSNPYRDVQNDSYVLEDMNGKKYSQRKYCNDDKIPVDEEHYYLKFTDVKPSLTYQIRYILQNGKYGHIIYDNLSFAELMSD